MMRMRGVFSVRPRVVLPPVRRRYTSTQSRPEDEVNIDIMDDIEVDIGDEEEGEFTPEELTQRQSHPEKSFKYVLDEEAWQKAGSPEQNLSPFFKAYRHGARYEDKTPDD
eukprot:TRINITY_DN22622_c0_g1_i1.p1 TRINITY_DN22622_c0_g1~~TRINITY_DN22622_c0_g1_i1.p1  ORF type:complete len:110 (-),score=22.70 TRINITY_DN22622_c0_g1_i1:58-387(-)